eukprot:gene2004-3898_t
MTLSLSNLSPVVVLLVLSIHISQLCETFSINITAVTSSNLVDHESFFLSDPSTSSYFNCIYGPNTNPTKVNRNNIDMIYGWNNIDLILPYNKYMYKFTYMSPIGKENFRVYKDYEWAEVSRSQTGTRDEGYSSGLIPNKSAKKFPYGCWFHRYGGSGIFINVGKTIAAKTRKELMTKLKISGCENDNYFNCHREDEFCIAALKQGYDSIQVDLISYDEGHYYANFEIGSQRHHGSLKFREPELILCSGKCATVTFSTACPPGVELRTGLDASKPCHCDDSFSTLNCANGIDKVRKDHCYNFYDVEKKRKSCFLLGDTISGSPISASINILYLNKQHDYESHQIQSIISNIFHSSDTNSNKSVSMSMSGSLYVLSSNNIILREGVFAIEHQLTEHDYKDSDPAAIPDVRVIPVQNMYVRNNGKDRTQLLLPDHHHHNRSYSYIENLSSDYNISAQMYDRLRGSPLSVIAISGTGRDSSSSSSSNNRLHVKFDHNIIDHIIDESVCIRRSRVSIVIVVVYGRIDRGSYHALARHLNGYVDVILENHGSSVTHSQSVRGGKVGKGKGGKILLQPPPLLSIGKGDTMISLIWNEEGNLVINM